ncbi:hypothetical protein Rt10032_c17g5836 [Rhodotorula toruloides]|uniref:Uncharacterized protein n=1 Tax=Rhodotorula toruloides TaxID=5286 RepID=A0A511KN73_RHOTO|nr:hypothetical protein Rt10032_c17g5836 [Rhodotorula toruloides]
MAQARYRDGNEPALVHTALSLSSFTPPDLVILEILLLLDYATDSSLFSPDASSDVSYFSMEHSQPDSPDVQTLERMPEDPLAQERAARAPRVRKINDNPSRLEMERNFPDLGSVKVDRYPWDRPIKVFHTGDLPNFRIKRRSAFRRIANEVEPQKGLTTLRTSAMGRLKALVDLYKTFRIAQTVIFCNTRRKLEGLVKEPRNREFAGTSAEIHLGLETPSHGRTIITVDNNITVEGLPKLFRQRAKKIAVNEQRIFFALMRLLLAIEVDIAEENDIETITRWDVVDRDPVAIGKTHLDDEVDRASPSRACE